MSKENVSLEFINPQATPIITELSVSNDSVKTIMSLYGIVYEGDNYIVMIDGIKVSKYSNGELIE